MPRAATALRAAAAATISLAPVEGFFWSSVLGVSSAGVMMITLLSVGGVGGAGGSLTLLPFYQTLVFSILTLIPVLSLLLIPPLPMVP